MTRYDFEHLFYVEKLQHLTENCPEVAKFVTWFQPTRHITIYAVEKFYVELVFDLGKRKVEAINIFETVEYLEKYRSFMAPVNGEIRGLINNFNPFDNL